MSYAKVLRQFLTESKNPATSLKDTLNLIEDLSSKNFFTYVLSCDSCQRKVEMSLFLQS